MGNLELEFEFINAIREKNLETAKELLRNKNFNPSNGDNFIMRCASHNDNPEIVKELLKDERVRLTLKKEDLKQEHLYLLKDYPEVLV